MEKKKVVRIIPKEYVSDNSIKYTLKYLKELVLLNPNGIIFSDNGKINSYEYDDRKLPYPYLDVYTSGLFNRIKNTNQILNFDTPYIAFSKKNKAYYATKYGREALLVEENLETLGNKDYIVNKNRLVELFSKKNNRFYIMDSSVLDYIKIPTDEEIENNYNMFLNYRNMLLFSTSNFLSIDNYINTFNYDNKINFDIFMGKDIFVVNLYGEDISIKKVKIYYIDNDKYRLHIEDALINKYDLLKIRNLEKNKFIKRKKM